MTTTNNDDLNARECALTLLSKILDQRTALDIALDQSSEFAGLSTRDRGFTRMLITTTLRRLGQIDDLINSALNRENSIKTRIVHHILRLGVTQIFFMETADHAAVDTSVRLVEKVGMDSQKGFVNAVLRTLIREGKTRIERQDAGRLNTPDWLLKLWIEDYGMAGAAQIAEANMNEPPLDITVKNIADRPYWGNTLQASELSTGTLRRVLGGNIREMDGFDDGKWWIQDAAAALPSQLFGEEIEGQTVLDLCAAPGGKTLQLASMGAHVTALDRSAKRLKRLQENLERMELTENVRVETADAGVWKPPQPVKYILLDAPCSATGTIRRHPDTGYLKAPKDIEGLTSIQERLLTHAANMLQIGGTLIYCTCSIQKDEGEHQIEKFLSANQNFERTPIAADEIGDYDELINENGDLRILPHHLSSQGGMDGFFISRLKRTG